MLKGIIFDIGGVLSYDINEYLFAPDGPIVTTYNLEPQSTRDLAMQLWGKYAHTRQDFEETWQQVEEEYWNEFKAASGVTAPISELIALTLPLIRPVPHMADLLAELKDQNYDLLICSNNTEFFYQRQKELAGFAQYFQKNKVILSNHYGHPKEEETATLFKAVESQMDYPKENYLFIDDRPKNIKAGLKYGLNPILFPVEAPYGHTYLRQLINKMK